MIKVEIFHNLSSDASFGVNTVFDKSGKREAVLEEERHALVLVFRYELPDDSGDDIEILNQAFETFNVGEDELAGQCRARKLRSLSKGDVVFVHSQAYSCESVGWRARSQDELRIITAAEAEPLIRERFSFRPAEALTITVPLDDA